MVSTAGTTTIKLITQLHKSFIYIGGGECAGVVLGARVPVILASRADSALARLASVALAVATARANYEMRDA